MEIREIQLFQLMQNQIMEINHNMCLTRMALPFRTAFKNAVGLPKKATHLAVLMAVGDVYYQNGGVDKFYKYINLPHCLSNGQPLVTYEMMKRAYGHKPTIAQVLV